MMLRNCVVIIIIIIVISYNNNNNNNPINTNYCAEYKPHLQTKKGSFKSGCIKALYSVVFTTK